MEAMFQRSSICQNRTRFVLCTFSKSNRTITRHLLQGVQMCSSNSPKLLQSTSYSKVASAELEPPIKMVQLISLLMRSYPFLPQPLPFEVGPDSSLRTRPQPHTRGYPGTFVCITLITAYKANGFIQ